MANSRYLKEPLPSTFVEPKNVNPDQVSNTSNVTVRTFTELNIESGWEEFSFCLNAKSFTLDAQKRSLKYQAGAKKGESNSFGTKNDRWDKALLLVGLHSAHGIRGFVLNASFGLKNVPKQVAYLSFLLKMVSSGEQTVSAYLRKMESMASGTVAIRTSQASLLLTAHKIGWLELNELEISLLKKLVQGPSCIVKRETQDHQPLPDAYVSEFGKRAIWVLDNWLEPMAGFVEYLDAVWTRDGMTPNYIKQLFIPGAAGTSKWRNAVRKVRAPIIEYLEKKPNLFLKPNFPLTWQRINRRGENLVESYYADGSGRLLSAEGLIFWSEESIAERFKDLEKKGGAFLPGIREQITIIQASLFFMLALLTGARRSELGSVPSNREPALLVQGSHGAMHSQTYKLSRVAEGNPDLWILPEYVARHLQSFHRLAKHSHWFFPGKKDTGFLYLSEKGSSSPSITGGRLKYDFDELAKGWGIDHLMDEIGLTDHRFRKTIARYIATCVNGGSTMIFHLFKHRAWEMTLHYINTESMIECLNSTDEELRRAGGFIFEMQKDIEKEAKECVIEAYLKFLNDQNGNYVGGGIKRIRDMDADFIALKTTEDKKTWVFQLSEGGTALNFPAYGVSCIKPRNQKGECNRSSVTSSIEPSQCKTYCEFHVMDRAEAEKLERQIEEQTQKLLELLQMPNSQDELRHLVRPLAIGIRESAERLRGLNLLPASVSSNHLAMALIDAPAGQWMEVLGL
ncbi:MAG: hypothetical protein U1D41_05925 [Nitrosomonas sp.]|uniref:hypothetical protein n=1 Tax=Nitrosomonas sp. TaxID=42353 RepID=UPI002ABA85F2|nr:hypothetical protein [Nitrosomonas sp.]MDZ4105690.1 hypothetical protein [Nitrosomonas sp.]